VLLQQFGHDFVFALQLLLELLELPVLGVLGRLGGFGLATVLEGGMSVLEEFLLPAIEYVGCKPQFIAEIGDGRLLEQVPLEDGYLLLGREVTTRNNCSFIGNLPRLVTNLV
jgi:hypothetical protein